MPTIRLTDRCGFDYSLETAEDSGLGRFLRDLTELGFPDLRLAACWNKPLDEANVQEIRAGFTADRPAAIGPGADLLISAGAGGSVVVRTPADKLLLGPDHYGDPVTIGPNEIFLGVRFTGTLSADLSNEGAPVPWGFAAGTEIVTSNYRRFTRPARMSQTKTAERTEAAKRRDGDGAKEILPEFKTAAPDEDQTGSPPPAWPTFGAALAETLAHFCPPADPDDLEALPPGTVTVAEGQGTLRFSARFNLGCAINPLLLPELPLPVEAPRIKAGGTFRIAATAEWSGDYQLRAWKTDTGTVRLGYYRKKHAGFELKVSAQTGLSARAGGHEWLEELLAAVSPEPSVDRELLAGGGVDGRLRQEIGGAVRAGVQRKLEIALAGEFEHDRDREAMFLFELDLLRLDAAGRQLVRRLLQGDLEGLTGPAETVAPGIRLVRSLRIDQETRQHTLKINLLGILNYVSIGRLLHKGTVKFEAGSGDLLVTDRVAAVRIEALAGGFAAAPEKLRQLLAESFLATAACRCSGLLARAPELRISHSYVELHARTNRQTMKDNLDVVEALGLLLPEEKDAWLGRGNDFGRSLLCAETRYGAEAIDGLFLRDGAPRPREDYEKAGREAFRLLVRTDDPGRFRRLPCTDDRLWARMRRLGQPGFRDIPRLRRLNEAERAVIAHDYSLVVWWAGEMHGLSRKLAEIRRLLGEHPGTPATSEAFEMLRRELAGQMRDVAHRTRKEFGDPWGLVAMDLAAGRQAAAEAHIVSPGLNLQRRRG